MRTFAYQYPRLGVMNFKTKMNRNNGKLLLQALSQFNSLKDKKLLRNISQESERG